MNWLPAIVLALILAGCATKAGARREAERALFEGQQRALFEQQLKEPAVWFRGDVRHQRIPWTDGITLVEAIAAAEYTWNWDPRRITVTRNGEVHVINPRRLLRGQENPLLEPGDVVEVRR